MYYQNYEDYMKNVLGSNYTQDEYMDMNSSRQIYPYNNYNYYVPTYTQPTANAFQNNNITDVSIPFGKEALEVANLNNESINANVNTNSNINIAKIRKMYPDIYVILNPMVEKTLSENANKEITEEVLEAMTNQIYDSLEEDMIANTKVASNNNSIQENKNRNLNKTSQVSTPITAASNLNKTAVRRIGNPTLRDLIKILLINKLLENFNRNNRPGSPGNRMPRPMPRQDYRPPIMPMPRVSYPVMNYFSTPYPEDEYIV